MTASTSTKTQIVSAMSKRRWQWLAFLGLFLGYWGSVFCRTATEAVMPAMMQDKTIQFDKRTAGTMLACGNGAFILGKILCGVASESFGGTRVLTVSLLLVAFFAIAYARVFTASMLIGSYMLLKLFTAIWPAITKLLSAWFDKQDYGKVLGGMSIGFQAGSVIATVLIGSMLSRGLHWRTVVTIPAVAMVMIVCLKQFILYESPSKLGLAPATRETESPAKQKPQDHPMDPMSVRQALVYMMETPVFWVVAVASMALSGVFELQIFMPLYFKEALHLTPGQAAQAAALAPAGAIVSLVIGGGLYDRLRRQEKCIMISTFLLITVMCIGTLWQYKNIDVKLAVVVAFFLGFSVTTPFFLPITIFYMSFGGKRHTPTVTGILDCLGSLAAVVMDNLMGSFAWKDLFAVQLGCAVAGLVSLALLLSSRHST
ncbi:probable hexose phosphate transport protein isoform X1 [Branchiostoma floridae]|uniref:Probable hexose phosphate transport protein isoform X1 n=1 Tax=Branchiostoma floridae TaxID=7739 RepID=A0A9J7LJH4_BRAFL|nr:probable hexose phosphate transport protein isoform X1 [Branchiostoma floridae]